MITGLAQEIERIRDQQRGSYRRLARSTGLSISTVYSALSYRQDDLISKYLDQFCQVLGIDADDMIQKYLVDSEAKGSGKEHEIDDDSALEEAEDNSADIDPNAKGCRYDRILKAVRDGVSDRKIMAAWPEVTGDVLNVYHQIADGTLKNMSKRGGMYGKHYTAIAKLCTLALYNGTRRVTSYDENGLYIYRDDQN